MKVTWLHC